MNHLRKFNEGIIYITSDGRTKKKPNIDEIMQNLYDICLELKDKGFSMHITTGGGEHDFSSVPTIGHIFISRLRIRTNTAYDFSEIEEVVERIKDYMESEGYVTKINHTRVKKSVKHDRRRNEMIDPVISTRIVFKKIYTPKPLMKIKVNEAKINNDIIQDIKDIILEMTDDKILQYQTSVFHLNHGIVVYCGNETMLCPNQSAIIKDWRIETNRRRQDKTIDWGYDKNLTYSDLPILKLGNFVVEIYQIPKEYREASSRGISMPFEEINQEEVQEIIDRITNYMSENGYRTIINTHDNMGYTNSDFGSSIGCWAKYMMRLEFKKVNTPKVNEAQRQHPVDAKFNELVDYCTHEVFLELIEEKKVEISIAEINDYDYKKKIIQIRIQKEINGIRFTHPLTENPIYNKVSVYSNWLVSYADILEDVGVAILRLEDQFPNLLIKQIDRETVLFIQIMLNNKKLL